MPKVDFIKETNLTFFFLIHDLYTISFYLLSLYFYLTELCFPFCLETMKHVFRRKSSSQAEIVLKTVTYTTPHMEERRKKEDNNKQIKGATVCMLHVLLALSLLHHNTLGLKTNTTPSPPPPSPARWTWYKYNTATSQNGICYFMNWVQTGNFRLAL